MTNNKKTMREWRAYRGFTKKGIAEVLQIHPSTYANWENNPSSIRLSEVDRIAGVYGCNAEQIIFFDNNPSFKLGCEISHHG